MLSFSLKSLVVDVLGLERAGLNRRRIRIINSICALTVAPPCMAGLRCRTIAKKKGCLSRTTLPHKTSSFFQVNLIKKARARFWFNILVTPTGQNEILNIRKSFTETDFKLTSRKHSAPIHKYSQPVAPKSAIVFLLHLHYRRVVCHLLYREHLSFL